VGTIILRVRASRHSERSYEIAEHVKKNRTSSRLDKKKQGAAMYVQVATKLSVASSAEAFSQAVSMSESNACQVEFTVINLPATNIRVTAQVSNDLENWTDAANSGDKTAVGYYSFNVTGVAAQYVRLKYTVSGSGNVIVAAGINTANL
jgi:hypothetical protein